MLSNGASVSSLLGCCARWLKAGVLGAVCTALLLSAPAAQAHSYLAFVGNSASGTISTIFTDENFASWWWLYTNTPGAMAITPDGSTLYVCNSSAGTVTPISLSTGAAGTPIIVGSQPSGIAITPDGTTAYVSNYSGGGAGTVTAITLATGATSTIAAGNGPSAVAITPDGRTVYVVNRYDGTLTPISTATRTAGSPIRVGAGSNGSQPDAIAIAPDGSTAYIAEYAANAVVPLAVGGTAAGSAITGLTHPTAIAVTPDGAKAYVTEDGSPGGLIALTLATHALGTRVTVGTNPYAVALTPNQSTAYVANYNGGSTGSATPVALGTNTASWPISTGSGPKSVVITPDQAPVAHLTASPAQAGKASSFDASASTVKYGTITSYAWNFGDGHTAITTSPITSHTYAAPGSYPVTLTETDSAGTSTSQVYTGQVVSRNGGPSARLSQVIQIPKPNASTASSAAPVAIVGSHTVVASPAGLLRLRLHCKDFARRGCRGTLTIQLAPPHVKQVMAMAARCARGCRRLGQRSFRVSRASTSLVFVPLNRYGRHLLARRRVLSVKAIFITRARGPVPTKTVRTLHIRRPSVKLHASRIEPLATAGPVALF